MICSLFFLWIYTDIFFNNCPELLCLFRIFQAFNIHTGMELQITLSARASRKKKPSENLTAFQKSGGGGRPDCELCS